MIGSLSIQLVAFDNSNTDACGVSGRKSGLYTWFDVKEITNVPYRTQIEVPFFVFTTTSCLQYNDIPILIHSGCESLTETPYQYGVTTNGGDVNVDYSTIIRTYNTSATFSVSWKAPTSVSSSTSSINTGTETNSQNTTTVLLIVLIILVSIVLIMLATVILLMVVRNKKDSNNNANTEDSKNLLDFYDQKPDLFNEQNIRYTVASSKKSVSSKKVSPTTLTYDRNQSYNPQVTPETDDFLSARNNNHV